MQRSSEIGELIAALAKAQAEFGSATKEITSNAFAGRAYKYADLAANIGAVRPALSKHGIALMQFNESDLERQTASVTTALHFGEQFISITAEAPALGRNGFDVQSIGACWTYLRRYTLQAICGLASEDDDGEQLAGADNKPIQRRATPAEAIHRAGAEHTYRAAEAVQKLDTAKTEIARPSPGENNGPFLLAGDLVQCVIKSVTEKETKGKKPYLTIVWNGRVDGFNYASCFHASLFPVLKAAVNKEINLRISPKRSEDGKSIQYFNIDDVLWFDGTEYEKGQPKSKTLEQELLQPFPEEARDGDPLPF